MTFTSRSILLLAMCGLSASLAGGELVREFKGSRSTQTAEFEARAPWIMDWRVTSEFGEGPAVDVSLLEGGSGIHLGSVLQTRMPGNGVRMFNESGRFAFRVNATMANWTLRVEQLTPEEAEAYTPIGAEPSR
jgi:hypothetical protein